MSMVLTCAQQMAVRVVLAKLVPALVKALALSSVTEMGAKALEALATAAAPMVKGLSAPAMGSEALVSSRACLATVVETKPAARMDRMARLSLDLALATMETSTLATEMAMRARASLETHHAMMEIPTPAVRMGLREARASLGPTAATMEMDTLASSMARGLQALESSSMMLAMPLVLAPTTRASLEMAAATTTMLARATLEPSSLVMLCVVVLFHLSQLALLVSPVELEAQAAALTTMGSFRAAPVFKKMGVPLFNADIMASTDLASLEWKLVSLDPVSVTQMEGP